ncbi:MAG: hypothetical protein Q9216_000102 [Gyalolechia sp. 2 TL-2023]
MASGTSPGVSSASSDDESVSVTSTVVSEKKEIYTLEAVLWEREEDGVPEYLVKWENYDDVECTWERKEHFHDEQTLVDWKDQKMRISRGLVEPFDLGNWERRVHEAGIATAKRRARRRKKRIALGLPVADHTEEDEELEPKNQELSSEDSFDDDYDDNLTEFDRSEAELFSPLPVWTAKEESTLLEGLTRIKALDWKRLLKMYGSSGIINEDLKEKTENDLCRKVVSLRKHFEASSREFPVPQLLDKTNGEDPLSRGKDKPVRKQRDQQKQAPPHNGCAMRIKDVGSVHSSKPQDSPRAPSDAMDRPKRPEIKMPLSRALNSRSKGSASTIPKGLSSAKAESIPTSPSTTAPRRPTQLGMAGRGPARRGVSIAKVPREQPVNIMKNWGTGPVKRRRSRYEWRTPQEAEARPGTTFKKFSTRRRFELAGRYEHAPDASSLTFVDRKDGKVLSEGPASILPRPATKTPFQLFQEQLAKDQAGPTDPSASAARSSLQRAANLEASTEGLLSDKGHIDDSNDAGPAIEASLLPQITRPVSVPSEPNTQLAQRDEATFAAPVAVMDVSWNDNDVTPFEQCMSPQSEASTSPKLDTMVKTTGNARKRTSEGHGIPHLNLDRSASQVASLSGTSSHNHSYIHPDRKHAQTPHNPSQPVLQQPMSTTHQARGPHYKLFPLDVPRSTQRLDTYCGPTDVIAEILTGSEGDSTGTVIFRGLQDRALKYLFITIRIPPQQMHVWCKTLVTADEFATFFHDPPRYLGSGWIVPYRQSVTNVEEVSGILTEHGSGAMFFAEKFTILLYPASCISWEYLDRGLGEAPPEARLRFAMLDPWPWTPQTLNENVPPAGKFDLQARLQAPLMNAVMHGQLGLDFQRLVACSKNKDGSSAKPARIFFLIFPPAAQEEFDILVDWIRANGPATIYSLEPMSSLAPDPHLIRLFPAGTSILLTDSLFLLRPLETARILSWFRLSILVTKPQGTWKICTRPAIREWLLKIQASLRPPNGNYFVSCYGEVMRLLPNEMTNDGEYDTPKEKAHIACMGAGMRNFHEALGTNVKHLVEMEKGAITQNDDTLCSWFAGWAMTKQEKFRRFHIVTGRDEDSDEHRQLKERMKKYSHARFEKSDFIKVEVVSFERFAKKYDVWDSSKLKRKDDERRAQAGGTKKAADAKVSAWMRRGSAATAGSEDMEMNDAQQVEEQSLFLPMAKSPS